MKKPLNCWEFHECGREVAGNNADKLGLCPAAVHKSLDGIHRGDNAGRACWIIAGTHCGGKVQGGYASKLENCEVCDFFQLVMKEEQTDMQEAMFLLEAMVKVAR
jgi:hypothetical protein